jgi:hypothetical protein
VFAVRRAQRVNAGTSILTTNLPVVVATSIVETGLAMFRHSAAPLNQFPSRMYAGSGKAPLTGLLKMSAPPRQDRLSHHPIPDRLSSQPFPLLWLLLTCRVTSTYVSSFDF